MPLEASLAKSELAAERCECQMLQAAKARVRARVAAMAETLAALDLSFHDLSLRIQMVGCYPQALPVRTWDPRLEHLAWPTTQPFYRAPSVHLLALARERHCQYALWPRC